MILVSERNLNGQIKTCSIHDLMRELCLEIVQEEKFLEAANSQVGIFPEGTINYSVRHLSIHLGFVDHLASEHDSRARSLLYFCDCPKTSNLLYSFITSFPLVRVFDALTVKFVDFPVEIIELVHLRYVALTYSRDRMIPASTSKLRKLQTLIVFHRHFCPATYYLLPEIWKMPQLRHLVLSHCIMPYPSGALESLQTLSQALNLRFTKEVLRMIRNVKKLGISYYYDPLNKWSSYRFENSIHLHQLENLRCLFIEKSQGDELAFPIGHPLMVNHAFPPTLKKLTLSGCKLHGGDVTTVGSLPNLEVLKLNEQAFQGPVCETNEGEFRRLKFLLIETTDLRTWITDETHFPSLQHQSLRFCSQLLEIPSQIGFIPTLQVIGLYACRTSAVASGRLIQEEQEELGNDVLQVRVYSHEDDLEHDRLSSLRKKYGMTTIHKRYREPERVASALP